MGKDGRLPAIAKLLIQEYQKVSYQLIQSLTSEHWVRLSGRLTVREFQALQALSKLSLERFGKVRILVELEDFQGWSKEPGWEDSYFLTEDTGRLSKLAFVGDEKWKDEVFMFVGKEMRSTAIEFFSQDQLAQAKAWLSNENSQSMFLD